MLGIFFYSYAAIGLGSLLPPIRAVYFLNFGARFIAGYGLLTLYVYVVHVLARLSLDLTIFSTLFLATIGIGYAIFRDKFQYLSDLLIHPAFVLIVIGVISVQINGGIDYIPFTIDEFTNWLGASRQIYLHGDYESIRKTIRVSGYTPGWRLLLMLPWQIVGAIEEGLSAAAPFVFHVAVVALIFDIAVFLIRSHTTISQAQALFFAWVFLVVFLAAEAMGKLWTYTLLIEQPQIYSISAVLLFLYLSAKLQGLDGTSRQSLFIYAGITLAMSYLIKSAALLFIPTIAFFAAVPILNRHFFPTSSWRMRLEFSLLVLAPIVIILVTWSIMNPSQDSLGSPISTLGLLFKGNFALDDITDLASRYLSAIWNYTSAYKLPITLGTLAGALFVLFQRRDGSLLIWAGFTILCSFFVLGTLDDFW